MSKREIVTIIVLLVAGFIAYEVFRGYEVADRNEVAPGETPQVAGTAAPAGETPQVTGTAAAPGDEPGMRALVPAVRAGELYAAVAQQHDLPPLPAETGLLAVPGNPGEFFFTRRLPGRAEVCLMRADAIEVLWITATDQILEIVGAHGSELLVKLIDEPFDGPADAWQPGGFLKLDVFATGEGLRPADLDDRTVADVRALIR